MSTEIIKYIDLHKITTFSKKEYFIESEKVDRLLDLVQNNKFVKVGINIINSSSIDTIDKARPNENLIENIFGIEKISIQERARRELGIYRESNPRSEITDKLLIKIVKKVKGLEF